MVVKVSCCRHLHMPRINAKSVHGLPAQVLHVKDTSEIDVLCGRDSRRPGRCMYMLPSSHKLA